MYGGDEMASGLRENKYSHFPMSRGMASHLESSFSVEGSSIIGIYLRVQKLPSLLQLQALHLIDSHVYLFL